MITIDYKDKRPIYEQVTEKIENLIVRGILEDGNKLPSVRSMAIELSLNPNTIQKAYMELERAGYVYSVKGKGNFVAAREEIDERKREMIIEESRKLVLLAKSLGVSKDEFLNYLSYVLGEVGL